MALRHKLAPGKIKTGYHNQNFWMRSEWVICPTCGGKFFRTHNKTIYCSEQCCGARPTDRERLVINSFIEQCKKHELRADLVFAHITHRDHKEWYRFSRPEKYGHVSKERKDRYVMLIKKFIADLIGGWYDLEPVFRRRMTPGQPHCPMKIPSCKGAFLKGDCPRSLRDCDMSGF